jgi:hypothetical protein
VRQIKTSQEKARRMFFEERLTTVEQSEDLQVFSRSQKRRDTEAGGEPPLRTLLNSNIEVGDCVFLEGLTEGLMQALKEQQAQGGAEEEAVLALLAQYACPLTEL